MAEGEEAAAAEAGKRIVVNSENMSHGDNTSSLNTDNNSHPNETRRESHQVSGTPSASSSSSSSSSDKNNNTATNMNKGKSCKGCLYYSSTFKSNSRNPLCVGFTRSLPNGTSHIKFQFFGGPFLLIFHIVNKLGSPKFTVFEVRIGLYMYQVPNFMC